MTDGQQRADAMGRLAGRIAFWQAATFLMLICFIWVHEVLDLPAVLYGMPRSPVDWIGASILTSGVIVIGFITVAHTFQRQRQVLQGFLIVCCQCGKVKIEETSWEQLEQYVAHRSLAQFSHGICPDCYGRALDDMDEEYEREAGAGEGSLTPGCRCQG